MSASLKAQYKALTGDDADARWSDATLKKKVDEAKAEQGVSGGEVDGPSKEAASGAPVSDEGDKLATEPTPKAVKSGVLLDEKTLLQAKAIELHVEVDPEWDEERLKAEIQIAREGRADLQVKGAVPPSELADENYDAATKQDKVVDGVEVELTRDYWFGEDDRKAAGSKIVVSRDKARELQTAGLVLPPSY
ncbi:MAG TPA: hypothetical protein VMA55_15705 [Acidovorax sp.]|nr:hypothetical protein [Acidovorax sp.]